AENAKMALPAWYHIGTEDHPTGLHRRQTSECLKTTHNLRLISDVMNTTRRLRDNSPNHTHRVRSNCACRYCKEDKILGCTNPHACCEAAQGILTRLKPKWHPLNNPQQDDLTLTNSRLKINETAMSEEGFVTFDPSIKRDEDISHIVRAF
ncbi:hypothetical protein FIBSPDRAFT_707547, partial [Athelia psychrophila]